MMKIDSPLGGQPKKTPEALPKKRERIVCFRMISVLYIDDDVPAHKTMKMLLADEYRIADLGAVRTVTQAKCRENGRTWRWGMQIREARVVALRKCSILV